ncbi:ferrochelatase [Candidatus Marsarchaeota G2 archaeon OSP_D]|jgi:ferrochelatase|uniref:Ferrochelatase n=2 Tax=Candidatus Marsarchaeota group 2 TaxID=2203771 RepID=A0A2R6BFL3_9ARCH|nr:MAG: ferrochelatase [Candidatus Marsarchaeota G2 archaeon OSP_D]PSN97218.1 MAG: ferrochelatase [Candidatus Marsarchaeota G2 archaeon ECH_B_SAG-C16]
MCGEIIMMSYKNAVILMAYGGAESVDEIPAYLRHIRAHYSRMTGGGEPTREEVEDLVRRYRAIGGYSPLLRIVRSLSQKLETHLNEQGYQLRVYYGMKHSKPFIQEVFEAVINDEVENLLGIVLAPHYSTMSVRGYHEALVEANKTHGGRVHLTLVDSWHLNPTYIDRLAHRIEQTRETKFNPSRKVFYLFTAHSLPEKITEWGDPYPAQLHQTVEALASKLNLKAGEYGFAYQSASSHGEPWLGPSVEEKLEQLRAQDWRNVLVAPIGFVSDHLEILYDIDIELTQKASELGLTLERIESFNDSDDFVEVLASVIAESGFKAQLKQQSVA